MVEPAGVRELILLVSAPVVAVLAKKEGTTWNRKATDRGQWKALREGYILQWMDKAKVKGEGCLTSQQHASVSQERMCSDKLKCCHTEIEVADQTFYLTQSQYTDTGPPVRALIL